jgi:hypothetical protein
VNGNAFNEIEFRDLVAGTAEREVEDVSGGKR